MRDICHLKLQLYQSSLQNNISSMEEAFNKTIKIDELKKMQMPVIAYCLSGNRSGMAVT